MRARLDELVTAALQRGAAVPAFTCYDFTTATAVVEAAEDTGLPVILNVAPKTAATRAGQRLIAALRGLADGASVPVCVQLDHASDVAIIVESVRSGADCVLADGSSLAFEENVALVREVRAALAADGAGSFEHDGGAAVVLEAELGGLAGDEDKAFGVDAGAAGQEATGLTDPGQVPAFVEASGAQLLAVAIGNVHGKYKGAPQIRWDVLERISAATDVPLVLHGASGIPADELLKARALGVGKVNFNTELRTGILATLEAETAAHRADGENLQGLLGRWSGSAREFAAATLRTLGE
ncbi:fructose-bisphosphate aldolase [Arthrobacter sp. SW1]|uniref:class II fructose-bisphosphate aldolase n=1 Tax=Arthrobacter sp. SW1 TaxID=1920889 RepID=UPI000877D452|nr:class II fructose-bisphosphate aldolase [Arthrobacter sp. SW1]OFI39323.1 fructose-bisphosphate aldolase [Arthrobacter sp. SW1]